MGTEIGQSQQLISIAGLETNGSVHVTSYVRHAQPWTTGMHASDLAYLACMGGHCYFRLPPAPHRQLK